MGVLEEREEQLLGEVQSTSCSTTLLKSKQPKYHSQRKKKLNPGPQVEAEGAARRKAEARALEAEGRVQVL